MTMNDGIDVIIPARNEAETILPIVSAFAEHPAINRIIVGIDTDTNDGSTELLLKAPVMMIFGASGKGQIVSRCLTAVTTPYVIFCDADLIGFQIDHISQLIGDAVFDVDGENPVMTIGVPDIPENFPTERIWAWPWVSGERCVPTRLVRPLILHGYLMETQINAAARHAKLSLHFEWLSGLASDYKMTPERIRAMEEDAKWGRIRGIL
jgi:glycosyltransferase involved in cell wall biosynthesis